MEFSTEAYKTDQKFRKRWKSFMDWWEILALKKGKNTAINRIIDINGWVLFYWEELSDTEREKLKTVKDLLKGKKNLNLAMFKSKDDNEYFKEQLYGFKIN